MICRNTYKIIQEVEFEDTYLPSSIVMLDANLFVGLTKMEEQSLVKTQPESGLIIKYAFDGAELIKMSQCESFGAVLDSSVDPV